MIVGKIGKFNSVKCKKCGSDIMFTKIKGNNTGLYCHECGAWQKWLSKNEKNIWDSPIISSTMALLMKNVSTVILIETEKVRP